MLKFYDLKEITSLHADEYKDAVSRVIDSGWFLHGKETAAFEVSYARYIGTRHCIGTGNGLDALWLILRAYMEMGIMSEGDEVIVPANTFIATINAIVLSGLKPVLVEPTWEGLTIDTTKIEAAITPRTRAIITVHLYGRLAYDDTMQRLCTTYGLKLIEDNAQAQGCRVNEGSRMLNAGLSKNDAESKILNSEANGQRSMVNGQRSTVNGQRSMVNGQRTGSLGDAAAHSFYPGKNLGATGDAGAVTTDDAELAETIRALGNYGMKEKYVCGNIGQNSRMSEMDAAVLSVKLRYLDEDNRKRQQLAAYYYDNIHSPLVTLPSRLPDINNVYHLFPVFCSQRDRLRQHLLDKGIETLIHYPIPPHMQACYAGNPSSSQVKLSPLKDYPQGSLPITERIHAQELSLPMSPVITPQEAEAIVTAVNGFEQN